MADPVEVEVVLVGPDRWREWRQARLASLQDSPDAFGSTYAREAAFTEADFRQRLSPEGPSVLAFADGEPVATGAGFVDLPGWCHVVAMWVDPRWRGRGIGRRVLDQVAGWADARGLRVHLDVAVDNAAARRLYARYGFEPTGETRPLREGSALRVERMVLVEPAQGEDDARRAE